MGLPPENRAKEHGYNLTETSSRKTTIENNLCKTKGMPLRKTAMKNTKEHH
jgi:hypothetical protein